VSTRLYLVRRGATHLAEACDRMERRGGGTLPDAHSVINFGLDVATR
jgi:hypothetical protein